MHYRFDEDFLILSVQVHEPTTVDEGCRFVKIPKNEFRNWLAPTVNWVVTTPPRSIIKDWFIALGSVGG